MSEEKAEGAKDELGRFMREQLVGLEREAEAADKAAKKIPTTLKKMTVDDLVREFERVCVAQDAADAAMDFKTYRRLVDRTLAIIKELYWRPGNGLKALKPLLSHPNPEVRVYAAAAAIDEFPEKARETLQRLIDDRVDPQMFRARESLNSDGVLRRKWLEEEG